MHPTGGVGERGRVGDGCATRLLDMRDQAVKRQASLRDRGRDSSEIGRAPFGRDTKAGLAHEGRREVEPDRRCVEARQNDLAARRKAGNERIQQRSVATAVVDGGVVAAFIGIWMRPVEFGAKVSSDETSDYRPGAHAGPRERASSPAAQWSVSFPYVPGRAAGSGGAAGATAQAFGPRSRADARRRSSEPVPPRARSARRR